MSLSRLGSALLLAGAVLAGILVVLPATGRPVGIGGMDVLGPVIFLAVGLFGSGALLLAARPAPAAPGRLLRIALSAVAVGSVAIVTGAVRGSMPGVHADADALAVYSFMGGLLLLCGGLLASGLALIGTPGIARFFGAVILAAIVVAAVAVAAPWMGPGRPFVGATLAAMAFGFGAIGMCTGWSGVSGGRPSAGPRA